MAENILYYGDNLDIMREHLADNSVDLEYLDPPFNSSAVYNVLFREKDGTKSEAQMKAFTDTWTWDETAAFAYQQMVEHGEEKVSKALESFRILLGDTNMMAYLAMMAPRLVQLHRVLKPTGTIYLHCDPTASHHLKVLMDAIFDPRNFLNEVIWERFNFHADAKRWGRIHDVLLCYAKNAGEVFFSTQRRAYNEDYIESHFKKDEKGRLFRYDNALAAGQGPARVFFGKTLEPRPGTHWRWSQENIDKLIAEGRIVMTKTGMPTVKRYLDEMPGHPIGDVWTDIPEINSQARERLGYPTQKPVALLERVIAASCPEDGTVLDPFAGCGTSIVAAQKHGRPWIGIDITHVATNLIKLRLKDSFPEGVQYKVIGEPTTVADAQDLANQDPYQFQWWALGLVGARPVQKDEKKGSDKGIDGRLRFHDDPTLTTKHIIISVKAGHTGVAHVRDLRGVIDRENAEIGVLITMQEHTQPMRTEAASAGFYTSPWGSHPRIQLLTVADLLHGKKIDYNPAEGSNVTFRKAPKANKEAGTQGELNL